MANGPFYAAGLHLGEIVSQGLTKAKTGTPQFVLEVKILGVPTDDGNYDPHQQQYNRRVYFPITEKTVDNFAETLKQLGYTSNTFGALDPSHPDHRSFAGQQINLWCKYEEYQGNWRERWQPSRGGASMALDPLDARGLRELDSLFGRALGGKKPDPAKNRQTANVIADGTEITDDDIPF